MHSILEPTYRRHGDAGVFSRIDYAFSTLPTLQYQLGWGPMDHAYLSTRIMLPHSQHKGTPRVKDWIIGSDSFLKLGREQIITTLLDHDQQHTVLPAQEIQNMIEIGIPEGFERRLQLACPEDGVTELHVLNVVIKKLQSLAGKLAKQDRDRANHSIIATDRTLQQLHNTLQTGRLTDEDRHGINARISDLKMHLKDTLTQRAAQEDARIDTFQSSERGRMTKCSFTGIQDKKTHKIIDKLIVDDQEITDQDQIVTFMRNKYMHCTGQDRDISDGAVQDFLNDMDITLPKLTQDQ
jgi:hypothetical protein